MTAVATSTGRHAAAVAVVAALALGLAGCARAGGDAFQATVTEALRVDEGIAQTFTPGADAVAGVDLLTATYGEAPDADGELVVTMVDRAGDEAVARAEVPGGSLRDNAWVPVRFDEPAPAPDDAALRVEWTGDSPVGVWANVPPAGIDPDERLVNDPYAGGQLRRGGEAATGDLAFRVVGEPGPAGPAWGLARLAGGTLRSLAAAPVFTAVWAVALAAALALPVAGFRAARHR